MTHRIYVAGPMTGLPDFNYPTFYRAEALLLDLEHQVVNPARKWDGPPAPTWRDYMVRGISDVLRCDAVALLDAWDQSKGAQLERHIALELGHDVRPIREWVSHW